MTVDKEGLNLLNADDLDNLCKLHQIDGTRFNFRKCGPSVQSLIAFKLKNTRHVLDKSVVLEFLGCQHLLH